MLQTLNKSVFSIHILIVKEAFTRPLFHEGFVESTLAMLIFAHPKLIIYESQNSQTLKRRIPRSHMRLYDLVQDLTNPSRTIKKIQLSESDDLSPKSFTNEPHAHTLCSRKSIKINWGSGAVKR